MAYPIIILGAGASYDYIGKEDLNSPFRPPLMVDLCDPNFLGQVADEIPVAEELDRALIGKLRVDYHRGKNLEESLGEIRDNAVKTKNEEKRKQLVSFEFFLQKLFQEISNKCANPLPIGNNYHALVDAIKDYNNPVCVIDFNYDILLERCLGIPDDSEIISTYVQGPVKIIKPHGSCDWMYFVKDLEIPPVEYENSRECLLSHTHLSNTFTPQKRDIFDKRITDCEIVFPGREKQVFYPAISIPLPEKEDFVCPIEHVRIMKEALNKTNKILIIGWGGGDKNLVKLMKEQMENNPNKVILVTIVAKDIKEVSKVQKQLQTIEKLRFNPIHEGGFTKFIRSEKLNKFFQD